MLEFEKRDLPAPSDNRSATLHKNISADLTLLTATAREAALAAGAIQRNRFGRSAQCVLENPPHDLKIEMDRVSEAAICSILRRQFPDHAILSEESGVMGPDSKYTWIIDPLDGTLNYCFGLPFFCTSVACHHTPEACPPNGPKAEASASCLGDPLVGVVFAPYFDWLFSATIGRGATCNGQPIRNDRDIPLADAVVSVSYGSRDAVIEIMEVVAAGLLRRAKKIRMFGSTALELALLAQGKISGLVQLDTNIWDFAAASLILTESGAAFDARPNALKGWQILAGPSTLFQPLRTIVDASLPPDFILAG